MTLQGPQRRKPAPGPPQRSLQRRNPVPQGPIRARFSILFGTIFGQTSILNRKRPIPQKPRKRRSKIAVGAFQLGRLFDRTSIQIRFFSNTFSMVRFWSLLAPFWDPLGGPMEPESAPMATQWSPNPPKRFPKSAKRQPGTRFGSVLVAPPALKTRPFPTDPPFRPILERF